MYSEALAIMDRNTVLYMCDEQKKEIEASKKEIEAQEREIEARKEEIEELTKQLHSAAAEHESMAAALSKKDALIAALQEEIHRLSQ